MQPLFPKDGLSVSVEESSYRQVHTPPGARVPYPLSGPFTSRQGLPGGSVVKNQAARQELQEMGLSSLGREDPLEKEIAAHSSILAWEILWTEEPGELRSMGLQRVGQG